MATANKLKLQKTFARWIQEMLT